MSECPFPAARDSMFGPAAAYRIGPPARVRLWNGERPWLVSRHADVRAALTDPGISADITRPGFPVLVKGSVEAAMAGAFARMDDPGHSRYRRLLAGEFTIRRMRELTPAVERIVDGALDDLAAVGPPGDLVRLVALPVPATVICQLLGVPRERHDMIQHSTGVMATHDSTPEQVDAAVGGLLRYLDSLVAEREREPGADLVSRLVAGASPPLSREELVTVCWLLLLGGFETTAHMIALGTLALLDRPEEFTRLVHDPALVDSAVEELLRYATIMQVGVTRVAAADMRVGGTLIRAGEGLILLLPTANRDPEAFPDPDRLVLTRRSRAHVAFGYGPHQCLGQTLARIELRATLSRLAARFPTLRLARPAGEVPLRDGAFVHGVDELPVRW